MDLLNLCLTVTWYSYGSSVFIVVAEIVTQNIEEQTLATYTRTIPLWLPYVDDKFTAVHNHQIYDFQEHPNRERGHTVYQERLLDQSPFNPTSHKASTIRTLTRLAQ